jgi:OFA family oxalate/formate antiporter-like MFS transporter
MGKIFYGWKVAAVCFLCCASYGTFYSFGILFKPLSDEFGWNYTLTSSVQSLHIVVYIISSFIVGWATDRFGPKWPLIGCAVCLGLGYALSSRVQNLFQLYVFYSIASFGAGIVWSLPLSTVQRWFIEQRALALGITISGIGIGTFVWAPIVDALVYNFGWRTAYLVMGISSALALLPAAFIVATPERKGIKPKGYRADSLKSSGVEEEAPRRHRQIEFRQALRTKQLWLICTMQLMFNIGLFLIFVHLAPYAIQNGIHRAAAARAVGLIGAFSIIGRILFPMIIEKKMRSNGEKALAFCATAAAVMLIVLTKTHTTWMLYFFVIIFGFFYGGWIPMVVALTGHYYGLKDLGTILGIIQLGLVGGIIGPLLGGVMYDYSGNYAPAFMIGALTFMTAGVIAFMIKAPIDAENPTSH